MYQTITDIRGEARVCKKYEVIRRKKRTKVGHCKSLSRMSMSLWCIEIYHPGLDLRLNVQNLLGLSDLALLLNSTPE
jgi:hypothetical protein